MKSVLFIYRNKNLADQFVKHLKLNEFSVYEFYDEKIPYYEFNFIQKIENIFYRVFFKNTQHIHKINERNFINLTNRLFIKLKNRNQKFDYCLIIRGDLIPKNVIEYARTASDKMIDYQLDGLSVSSKVLDYDDLFDQIYVFDKSDVENYPQYELKTITNCFFEDNNLQKKTIDVSYIGVIAEDRKEVLETLYDELKRINPDFNVNLYLKQSEFRKKQSNKIIFIDEAFTYEQCLDLSNQSKILVDIKRQEHNGLSLRFFEAMNYKNKIITNNATAVNYDFYHPDNIFYTDYHNFDGLEDFLNKPYRPINQEIISKYNFKNWINKLLD